MWNLTQEDEGWYHCLITYMNRVPEDMPSPNGTWVYLSILSKPKLTVIPWCCYSLFTHGHFYFDIVYCMANLSANLCTVHMFDEVISSFSSSLSNIHDLLILITTLSIMLHWSTSSITFMLDCEIYDKSHCFCSQVKWEMIGSIVRNKIFLRCFVDDS